MVIKWKDEYSCYDPVIDAQHAKLIDLINEMNDVAKLVEDGIDSYDELVSIFNELKDYAVYHFSHEEKMFEEHGYDSFNIKVQKIEHDNFKNKVSAINIYDLDENQDETVRSILDFLSKWLDHHILKIDKKFGEFLRDKNE
ncbi:MAG TPA: hemerythrin family protein [Clostridiaceae bacterium]|nr:hemerythrin family protein [Clostridiaceae bacterium]